MKVAFSGGTRLLSVGKSTRNGVDYTSDFLGGLIFLFLWRLLLVFAGGVFVFLYLLLYLLFCQHHGCCGNPLDVLGVLLLQHDCSAPLRTRLDTQPI